MEYDGNGSSITFTVGIDPVKLSYTIKEGDDNLGSQIFNKNDYPRTTDNPYSTGSVYFVIDWYEYATYW